jgi:circadian clock protein KaiB
MTTAVKARAKPRSTTAKQTMEWELRLYVAGQSPQSLAALTNLKTLCEAHVSGRYRIEIVDLLKTPQLTREDQIVAVPTVVRMLPRPMRRVIGNLANTQRALVGLQLRPTTSRSDE